jgi:Family of unknown function (DUF6155)
MSKLTARALRAHLRSKSHDALVEDIVHLSNHTDTVREYFAAQLGLGPQEDVLAKYKAIIAREFSGRVESLPRLSVARKAVLDYKKLARSPLPVVDLMLHYVECGVNFTNRFGDLYESFYTSVERMYEQALKLIAQHQLHELFQRRCKQLVTDTGDIGWGFHDQLSLLYEQTFEHT